MLDDLRHCHDTRPDDLPRGLGPHGHAANHLEQDGQEDLLVEGLADAVEVLLADADDIVVHVILVLVLALLHPQVHVLLNLRHPLDVELEDGLEQRQAVGLGHVRGQVHCQRHERLHSAVPDVLGAEGLGPHRRDLDQRLGHVLDAAAALEEVGVGLDRLNQHLQGLAQLLLVETVREALNDTDELGHDLDEGSRLLILALGDQRVRVHSLHQREDQLRAGRADLGAGVRQRTRQHRDRGLPVLVPEEAVAYSRRDIPQYAQRDYADGDLAGGAGQLRERQQQLRPILLKVVDVFGVVARDGGHHLPDCSPNDIGRLALDRLQDQRLRGSLRLRLEVPPHRIPSRKTFDQLPQDHRGLLS
mmetsp:Transcript_118683/g.343278  ORF Transcript_118683/g.343278 Transcript_118683/m.343278 type:complete len:360 (-) Transcript_118683:246-1325(-)